MTKSKVVFTYDVENYTVLNRTKTIVLDTARVKKLGVFSKRDYNTFTTEKTPVSAFHIEYEGNVYAKLGFTESDFEKLIQASVLSSGGEISYSATAGNLLETIVVELTADANIRAGSISGGDDISPEQPYTKDKGAILVVNIKNIPVFLTGVPAGSKVYFLTRKLN